MRVEIPAPALVRCETHGAVAELITMPNGQVRYVPRAQDAAPGTWSCRLRSRWAIEFADAVVCGEYTTQRRARWRLVRMVNSWSMAGSNGREPFVASCSALRGWVVS